MSKAAERVGARLVVVAGDVRAVALLRAHLPEQVDELVHEVGGGRSPDGSVDHVAAEAVRLVDTEVGVQTRRALEEIEAKAAHALAVTGAADVVRALDEARVEVLYVPGGPAEEPLGWFGDEPVPVALSPATLSDMGVDRSTPAPLVDVCIRAALGTDAGLRVVPSDRALPERLAALLRW